ncbi:MAG: helix-turn-helix transcriptional regulator [Bacteroidales bacterium]|nr:helix-turn-helix transcriptional regulator [Bacteroidales bacterium]
MKDIIFIGDRIKELISEKGIDVKTLAKNIGLNQNVVYRWLKHYTSIKLSNLIKLSDYFNCSIEYLSGRCDYEEFFTPKNAPPFSESLRQILKKKNITVYKILKDTIISSAAFHKWFNGAEPQLDTLIILADYLGCTIDTLIGRE